MLFNSFAFVLAFLPLALVVFYVTLWRWPALCLYPLIGFSLFFYAWWNPIYLIVLLASIAVNYGIGLSIITARHDGRLRTVQWGFVLGVAFNLGLLGYFKYANYFVDTANTAFALGWTLESVVLPLAISFFTFQQITFLADTRLGRVANVDLTTYCAFVSFFPQLIAGPIVHYQELVPQYDEMRRRPRAITRLMPRNLAIGLTIFVVGLFKKVVLADSVAPFADAPYDAAAQGIELTFVEAWAGTIAFTFQIYFDFSGYSDMAIGLGRMFGVLLPLNFHAPYKADSIVEFWRRWHMTLSRFLRDYLYVPLGGNRRGVARRYANLMIVMVLGGLWHGAGWTFVFWGTLHGLYLAVNHGWRALAERVGALARVRASAAWRAVGARAILLLAVVFAWVFFRADDLDTAGSVISTMLALDGLVLPETVLRVAGAAAPAFDLLGVRYQWTPYWFGAVEVIWFVVLLFFVLCLPTTQELMARYRPSYEAETTSRDVAAQGGRGEAARLTAGAMVLLAWLLMFVSDLGMAAKLATFGLAGAGLTLGLLLTARPLPVRWRRSHFHGLWTAAAFTISLVFMYVGHGKDFLYFQF